MFFLRKFVLSQFSWEITVTLRRSSLSKDIPQRLNVSNSFLSPFPISLMGHSSFKRASLKAIVEPARTFGGRSGVSISRRP